MTAFAPTANLVTLPTIDAALEAAYQGAAIYLPYTDVVVADPYKELARGLRLAYYIGQSQRRRRYDHGHGGIATDRVFAQVRTASTIGWSPGPDLW